MPPHENRLLWVTEDRPFPHPDLSWGADSGASGLLAVGDTLNAKLLERAYRSGIFPWYSQGQPVLWWSPDPRMVLKTSDFKLHPSLRKTLKRLLRTPGFTVHFDSDFSKTMRTCSNAPRHGQDGTWIDEKIIAAYCELHTMGMAHSVEVCLGEKVLGGLYCTAIGQAVFGESMFSAERDGSKLALAALVAFCRAHGISSIDCQQNTRHLASLGAKEIPRNQFLQHVAQASTQPAPAWEFQPLYWNTILSA